MNENKPAWLSSLNYGHEKRQTIRKIDVSRWQIAFLSGKEVPQSNFDDMSVPVDENRACVSSKSMDTQSEDHLSAVDALEEELAGCAAVHFQFIHCSKTSLLLFDNDDAK